MTAVARLQGRYGSEQRAAPRAAGQATLPWRPWSTAGGRNPPIISRKTLTRRNIVERMGRR